MANAINTTGPAEKNTEPTIMLHIPMPQALLFSGKLMNLFATVFGRKDILYGGCLASAKEQLLWINDWWRNATRGGSTVPSVINVWKLGATHGRCLILAHQLQDLKTNTGLENRQDFERAITNAQYMIEMLDAWIEASNGFSEEHKLRRFLHGTAVVFVRERVKIAEYIPYLPSLPGNPILTQVFSMTLGSSNNNIYHESERDGDRFFAGTNRAGKWLAQSLASARRKQMQIERKAA